MTDASVTLTAQVPALRAAAGYRRGIDLARISAAFLIVWDHAHAPGWKIGYLALALFLMLTSFLALQSYERSDRGAFWQKRAVRLIQPWLFWCLVFRAVYQVVSDAPKPLAILSDPFSLLIGPSIHLWFLPFVAILLCAVPLLSHAIQTIPALVLACVALAALSLPLQWVHANDLGPQPFSQWAFSLPLFLFGIVHAIAHRLRAGWISLATAAVISAVSLIIWPDFWSGQMILGALVFEAAWRAPIKGVWPTTLAGYAFGVYLMHPFFMLLAYKLFGPDLNLIFGAFFTFALSLIATEIIHRTAGLRQMA